MIKYIQLLPLLLSLLFITTPDGQGHAGTLKNSAHPGAVNCNDPHFVIHCVLQDKSGCMWFATTGDGVYRYDPSSELRTGSKSFTHFTEKDGLNSNTVWCIFEDKNGTLWIGTTDGVCCYNPSTAFKTGSKAFTRFSLPGTEKANFNPFANSTLPGSPKPEPQPKSVFCILQDKSGNMWFGTDYNGVYRYDPSASLRTGSPSFSHFLGNDGTKYNGGQAYQYVQCMILDKAGNVWMGSNNNGGLWQYNGKTFANFTTKDGLSENKIFNLLEDKRGNIWVATNGKGLCCYNGTSFTNFSTKDGLCNNIITTISEDKMGNLWLGSCISDNIKPGGICKYDGKTFTPYKAIEGLYNNDLFSSVVDKKGNIWFGGRYERLYRYDGISFTNFTEKLRVD